MHSSRQQRRQALRAHTNGDALETNHKEPRGKSKGGECDPETCPWKQITKCLWSHLWSAQRGGLQRKRECLSWGLNAVLLSFRDGYREASWFTRWPSPDPHISCRILENTNVLLRKKLQHLEEIFLWNTLGKGKKKSLFGPLVLENIWSFDAVLKKNKEKLME